MDLQKINPENRLGKRQSKRLVVYLDKEDWQNFMPMSGFMRMAPSELGRVLLKQALQQYQHREEPGNNVYKLTNQMPEIRSLSPRERETLELVAQGNSNKGISRILGISHQTTKNRISSIFSKLGAENRAHAVFLAVEQNLVQPKMSSQNNHDDNFRLAASMR